MTKTVLVLIFALPLIAQDASVEGRVTNQAGEPLTGARVDLRSVAWPQHDTLFDTDANGSFTLSIQPGRYQLHAGRTGYLWFEYPAPLTLNAGQRLTGLTLKMTHAAVLSGKIVDEDGDPVPAARVMLLSEGKKPAIVEDAPIRPDGSFVIGDLKAGNYYLRVEDRPTPAGRSHEVQGPRDGYVETYYPGVTDPARATLIRVEAGAEIRDLDFRIVKSVVSRLRGTVVDAAGAPVKNALVHLRPVDFGYSNGAETSAEGNFEMLRVPSGDYVLLVEPRSTPNDAGDAGHERLSVGASDMDSIVLHVGPALQVSGTIVIEGGGAPAERVRVSLDGKEGWWVRGGEVDSKPDGSFLLSGIEPASFDFHVTRLPPGAYLKEMRWGGQPFTDAVDLSRGTQGKTLKVVLSPHAGEIRGVVHDAKGGIAEGCEVTVRNSTGKAMTRNTDQTGAFVFGNVAPGEYLVGAGNQLPVVITVVEDSRIRVDTLSVP